MQSLQAGKRPDDACECVSGLIAESTGRCGECLASVARLK